VRARVINSMLMFERVPGYPFEIDPGYPFEIDTGTRTALYHVSDTSI